MRIVKTNDLIILANLGAVDEERPLDLVPADVGDLGEGAGEREDRLSVERRPRCRHRRRGHRRERCHRGMDMPHCQVTPSLDQHFVQR